MKWEHNGLRVAYLRMKQEAASKALFIPYVQQYAGFMGGFQGSKIS